MLQTLRSSGPTTLNVPNTVFSQLVGAGACVRSCDCASGHPGGGEGEIWSRNYKKHRYQIPLAKGQGEQRRGGCEALGNADMNANMLRKPLQVVSDREALTGWERTMGV
jgi:hypothetical protein